MTNRCTWATKEVFHDYHDSEWGVPVHDDKKHFEFLILEGAQAGLSWETILKRRKGYQKAFCNYNAKKVALLTDEELEERMKDIGIIRNRLKIWGARNNAQKFLEVQKEFGSFDKYIWSFVKNKTIDHKRKHADGFIATNPESDALALDMKKRGFKFAGSTIMYAHMQACGLINDHAKECFRYNAVN